MPNYIWTAKDTAGKPVVREITHDTVEESKSVLLAEGCTELALVQDEIMDAANAGFSEKCVVLGEEIKVTAEMRVKQMAKPPATLLRGLGEGLGQSKGLWLTALLLGAWFAYRGNTVAALCMMGGVLAWIAFITSVGLPGIYYTKLIKASDWNRWTEVLDLVDTLTRLRKVHFVKVPEAELTRNRAKALAGLGDLPGALELFRPCENQPGCPGWLYKAYVAGLHDTAKQYDKGIELTLEAIRENPCNALYLDLANRLVRYRRDAVGARAALAEAEKSTVSEIAKPFHLRCRGILAYVEGDYGKARAELDASLALMLKTPHVPFRDGHIRVAKAYLACVLVNLGDRIAAQKCFGEAREYLEATREDELLAECRQVMGAI